MISINIICLIIVGGMGSMPGVIVGAVALVGLPELLREFAEYGLLVYGAALVAMMLLKPEGSLAGGKTQDASFMQKKAGGRSRSRPGSAYPGK